jgi:hypothetical protein
MPRMDFASAAAEIDRCISRGLLAEQEATLHKQNLVELVDGAASNTVITVCSFFFFIIQQQKNKKKQERSTMCVYVQQCSHCNVESLL